MKTALIKNNRPHCSKCKVLLKEECSDVYLAEVEGLDRFYEFHRRCDMCGDMYKYYVDSYFESRSDLIGYTIKRVIGDKKEYEFEDE